MAKSMLAAVRAASAGAVDAADEAATQTGAAAPQNEDGAMPNENQPAAGADNAGIPKAEHDAAVAAAREEGGRAATDRLTTAMSADGIKGDGKRMAAALDLAVKSPGMSAADVAAFVVANVAAASAETPSQAEHEAGRMGGADLAGPAGAEPQKSGLSKNVDAIIARGKRD